MTESNPKPATEHRSHHKHRSFLHEHSLSVVAIVVLLVWIVAYTYSDPGTRLGSFFGNAIADWTGLLVMVLATKHLYERGSTQSKRPPKENTPVATFLENHSLTLFLVATGAAWIWLDLHLRSQSKWEQVTNNIVSEWTQTLGLVLMTKVLIERGSGESHRG